MTIKELRDTLNDHIENGYGNVDVLARDVYGDILPIDTEVNPTTDHARGTYLLLEGNEIIWNGELLPISQV